ncbi:MAG: hypothetical protein ACKO43_04120, partial [Alphaproteobacteria bacterium]
WDYIVLWTADNPPFSHADIAPGGLRTGFYLGIPIVGWGILAMAIASIYRKKALAHCWILFFLTLALSSLWVFVLINHGVRHIHLLPRHYYFCFILLMLFVFRLVASKIHNTAFLGGRPETGINNV